MAWRASKNTWRAGRGCDIAAAADSASENSSLRGKERADAYLLYTLALNILDAATLSCCGRTT